MATPKEYQIGTEAVKQKLMDCAAPNLDDVADIIAKAVIDAVDEWRAKRNQEH